MARIILKGPPNDSMEFNTGDAAERGDSPKAIATAVNAMMAEIYTYKSNYVYGTGSRWFLSREGGFSSGTCPNGSIRLTPFFIYAPVTIDALGAVVNVAEAGKSIQLSIYASDPVTNKVTGLPLCQTGSISIASTGPVFGTVTPVTLQPGLYYKARNSDSAGTGTTANASGAAAVPSPWASLIGTTTLANIMSGTGTTLSSLTAVAPFGTWPDLTAVTPGEVLGSSGSPAPLFRVQ